MRFWFSQNFNPVQDSSRARLGHFMCIETALFSKLDIGKACLYYVTLDYTNLTQLLKCLRIANACLTLKNQVNPLEILSGKYTVSIERLFMDDSSRYLNAQKTVEQFKAESITFLNKYKEIEYSKVGIDGYNYRVLNRLLISAIDVAKALRGYSNEEQ